MIVITGAAGFIGSCMLARLNASGITDVVIADHFGAAQKEKNYSSKLLNQKIDRSDFLSWFEKNAAYIDCMLHLGARTDTTEMHWKILQELNLSYSQQIWHICTAHQIPLIYASSAATYGAGEQGYADDHDLVETLKPLNLYGQSKNDFDKFVLQQKDTPPFWAGLKFFNVYGPNEYHKARMASVIFHAFHQISATGSIRLFRSHKEAFADGQQMRDFIYVKDVVDIMHWMMDAKPQSGLYNTGTGQARTFYDLAAATAAAMDKPLRVEWIDIPADIRDKYQYFTEAPMQKLRSAGYSKPFYSLENGIQEYVQQYLAEEKYY